MEAPRLLRGVQRIEVAPPPITSPIPTSEDPHTRMDRLEQKLRQMRASDEVTTWEDFDGAPMASLQAKFRMLEIERYKGIVYPRIHLRLYSTEKVRGFETEARGVSHLIYLPSARMRPPRHYQTVGQTSGFYYPPSTHVQYRPPAPSRPMTPTYLHPVSQPVFAHVTKRPPAPYT
ncbi:hypothetical protein AAG906_010547 [Vitis piasezkii]